MAKNIVELNIDNTSYTTRPFGICETAAGTILKSVPCVDFVLVQNATILVKFKYTNSASSPTLNVNSTGAKPIKWNGSTAIGNKIKAGDVYEFIYDGTNWLCLGGMDLNNSVTQIPTTSNIIYPLLMGMNPASSTDTITGAVRYHGGLTYNPSTQTLGLGVLNCTTNNSGDNSNTIDIFANRQLPTTFKIGLPTGTENIAPATYINLAYSGPGMNGSEAMSSTGLTIGPKIVNDTTTDGFLISTDKPLHIEGSSLSFGSNVIPNQNETYNLGSSDNKWDEVHAISFKGTADSARLIPYGVCETAEGTATKVVTTSVPFTLETGARVSVKFTNNNTASNITLNVNRTGAKNVYFNGLLVGSGFIFADNIYEFIFDGLNWILQGGYNTTGSWHSLLKLYLIGATSQSSFGVQTYSNSNVYTWNGAIYTQGGFYDESTTTEASPYKAVVPKDYTEDIGSISTGGAHVLSATINTSISVPSPKFGGLVGEHFIQAGNEAQITITPTNSVVTYYTTLAISLTADVTIQNFRFVRLLISVPITVKNNGTYPTTFKYRVQIKLNEGTFKYIYIDYPIAPGESKYIGTLPIIYDLMKNTITDDTANGITSWA